MLKPLFSRRKMDQELDEEIRSHLVMAVRDRIERGESPSEAEQNARREFGNVLLVKETTREMWGWTALESFARNARYALRQMKRSPGFTAVAISTLAVGIGATTAMFSIVNGVLLEPMKFRDPGRLYVGRQTTPGVLTNGPINGREFYEWRAHCSACEEVALVEGIGFTLTGGGDPVRLPGLRVSANFFRTLGVQPSLGRDFLSDEEVPGRAHVVILSDAAWRTQFAASASIIGRPITIDGEPYQVIGVMPPSLHLPKGEQWGPLFPHNYEPLIFRPFDFDFSRWDALGSHNYSSLIRLKPGIQPQWAISQMRAALRNLGDRDAQPLLLPLQEQVTAGARTALWLLLGAVGAMLLIVCVNLGNLILVRANGRYREAGVRLALGASRPQLFGLILREVLCLNISGGVLGLLLGFVAIKLFVATAPIDLPRVEDVAIDWRVAAFALGATAFSSVMCGFLPAWRLSRVQPVESLKSSSANASETGKKRRSREVLVSLEVALSTALLILGGLLTLSFIRLMHVDKGFQVEHIVTQGLSLVSPNYRQPAAQTRFIDDLLPKLAAVPRVRSAAITNQVPLRGETWIDGLRDADAPPLRPGFDASEPQANWRFVSPDYWKTMGIPLRQGRFIQNSDRGRRVVVLSQRSAQAVWPGQNPIGRRLQGTGMDNKAALEVVGVVSDIRESGLGKDPPLMAYEPYWQQGSAGPAIVIRTDADPAAIIAGIRSVVHSIDPSVPLMETKTMQQIMNDSVATRRFETYLAAAFAACALLLAALGVYGVVSYSVARRTPEIGIRIALGAPQTQIAWMVLREGMAPVMAGLAAGICCALLISPVVRSQLYAVPPRDPLVFGAVVVLLLPVALYACCIPARRAIRIEPQQALRFE